MSKNKREAKIKASLDLQQTADRLEEVVRSLRGGTVSFVNGDHSLALTPTGPIKLEISATQKSSKETISVELSWRREEEEEEEEERSPEFKITSEPAVVQKSGPTA